MHWLAKVCVLTILQCGARCISERSIRTATPHTWSASVGTRCVASQSSSNCLLVLTRAPASNFVICFVFINLVLFSNLHGVRVANSRSRLDLLAAIRLHRLQPVTSRRRTRKRMITSWSMAEGNGKCHLCRVSVSKGRCCSTSKMC